MLPSNVISSRQLRTWLFVFLILAVSMSLIALPGNAGKTAPQYAPARPLLPLFLPPVNYGTVGDRDSSLAVADLNKDGHLDVVAATSGGVEVFLGNGDGTLQTAVTFDSGGIFAQGVTVADVNRDAKPDILVVNECGDSNCRASSLGVLLGNGDGSFQPVVTYDPGGAEARTVSAADLNGDGKLDLVVSVCGFVGAFGCDAFQHGFAGVLLGNGDGTFQPVKTYDSGGYHAAWVEVADLNGDGKLDLVVANECSPSCANASEGLVGVLLGNGDGTFQTPVTYDPDASGSTSVIAADVNRDGHLDLIVGSCMASGFTVCGIGPGVVSVLVGNGDGSFQAPATYGTTLSADMVAVRDVNADGKLDLAIGGGAGCDVLLGNGDGTFHAARNFAVSGGAGAVAIADLNEDKHQDLVVSSSGVSVLLHVGNTTTTTKVTSTPNPSVYGQATFTANVSSSSGVPTGTVFFYEGLTQIGSTDLVGGIGTFPNSGADVGADAITAAYQGSVKYKPSLSAVLNQTVTQATTKTSVSSSSNPGAVGKTLTYTVAVVSQYGGSTTGQVTCLDNGSPLSHLYGKPLVFQKKYNAIGFHSIACTYPGDSNNVGSTAPTLVEQILYPTTATLTTSVSPSHLGQSVTYTATVSSTFGSIPNGEIVTFTYGTHVLGTATLSGGTAVLVSSALPTGTHTVKATYGGDASFRTSFGKFIQVVQP